MSDRPHNWHHHVCFGIHYDLHANVNDTELGRELTVEHLEERLRRVMPDWVQCDCKGHPGYTSWPTRVGSTCPGMVVDQLAIYREVTRRLGIKLGMHYSGTIDHRAVELHPEWAVVDAEGRRSDQVTCALGGYDEELLIPQMIELIDTYDVDGFWVDGENWGARACWCDRCRAEFAKRTGRKAVPSQAGDEGWEDWLAFHRSLFVEHVTRYAERVHQRKPDCLICSNWMYTIRQPEPIAAPVDYLSGDYTPTWGAERAALEGRMLDARGMTWDLMAWGFVRAGNMPHWHFKTALHLQQEVAEVLALGGAVMVYGKPQRTGWLAGWHQDLLGEVAAFCRARQAVCHDTDTASEAAVLHLADHYYSCNSPLFNYGAAVEPVEGALHALLENHLSVDLLPEDRALATMANYKLLVVPEQTHLSAAVTRAVEQFAESGGQVILSGEHLVRDCPDLVGARPGPEPPVAPSAPSWGTINLVVAERTIGLSGVWPGIVADGGTAVWAVRLDEQEPEKDATALPAITCRPVGRGRIVAVHGPLFRDYGLCHYPALRTLVGELIGRLDIAWTVTVDAPRALELVVRRKAGRLLINLVHRGAGETLSPRRVVIDELPPLQDLVVRVRTQARPTAVRLEPAGRVPEWSWVDGVAEVRVAEVPVHEVLVVDPGA